MSRLFSPLQLRTLTLPHRVFVSPMCQYSAEEGVPNDWHLVHLGSRAVGGASLVCVEASGVTPEGRITPWDTGIWNDTQVAAWKRITDFLRAQGAVPAMQLAHAGRKASTNRPWLGGKPLAASEGGWTTLGPSALAFGAYPAPRAMTGEDLRATVDAFRQGAARALAAGFDVVEVHGAHGYLLHQFCSPLSNHRTDEYGGSFDNRVRFPLEVARAVREAWPADKPVFYRISASDWTEGGWDVPQSIELCKRLKGLGIDLIDVSSGGNVADAKLAIGPGYQVPFAEAIRRGADLPVGAVGLIADPTQAEQVVSLGQADAVFLARAELRDPYWPRHAAKALGAALAWPDPYKRADVNPLGR